MKLARTLLLLLILVSLPVAARAVGFDAAKLSDEGAAPAETAGQDASEDAAEPPQAGEATADEAAPDPEGECDDDRVPPFFLPDDFKVYVRGDAVINHPARGFKARPLPTVNHYLGDDGGYVAVYTKRARGAVYGVGGGIYVIGQIRLQGRYAGRIFYPAGYGPGADITKDPAILELCDRHFPRHKGTMWVGGDTGGWFGIQ